MGSKLSGERSPQPEVEDMEAMLEAGLEWLVVGLVVGEGEEEQEEGWGPQLYRVVHSCFIPVISAIGIVGSGG